MEVNEKDIDLIEKYLDGILSEAQKKDFEKRLKSDAEFAKVFELRKTMPEYFQNADEVEAVRLEVATAIQKEKTKLFGISRHLVFSIAATIVVLIAVFITIQFSENRNMDQMTESDAKDRLNVDQPPGYADKQIVVDIEIIGPIDMQTFNKNDLIRFKWKSLLRYQAELIITGSTFDNIKFNQAVRLSDTFYDLPKNKLEPGTYRWCLMDTTYQGSFIIKE